MNNGKVILVIPDTQVRPGVPINHLEWIGQFAVDEFKDQDLSMVHLGDHFDMKSLSSYDRGKKSAENQRYSEDIKVGNEAFDLLCKPLEDYNKSQAKKKKAAWNPDKYFLIGNHCNRITVACENDARLEGTLSLDHLNPSKHGWKVIPFLEILKIEGIAFSHYFYNEHNGRAHSGTAENILKTVGGSFVQGHFQGLKVAQRSVLGKRHRALIAGSCYQHTESYRGPQAMDEWRGILVLYNCNDGDYDLSEVSLDYLSRRYTGKKLILSK